MIQLFFVFNLIMYHTSSVSKETMQLVQWTETERNLRVNITRLA